jgi:hypothetical protein
MKSYYPNLNENLDVHRYFAGFQEQLWEKVHGFFKQADRHLCIPSPKTGSGRYVQFPKSQQLIRRRELIEYADTFIKIKLQPGQILSLDDFCDKVRIDYDNFSFDEYEIIRRIVFSFYNMWDGRPTDEIKIHRFRPKNPHDKRKNHKDAGVTVNLNYESVNIRMNGRKISEDELSNVFPGKAVIPFIFDDDYDDWVYTSRPLKSNDKLLVLARDKTCLNYFEKNKRGDLQRNECGDLKMKEFSVFIFETCNDEIAGFANLDFDKREIYTTIGGIKARGNTNNVIGHWYDFALPRIKINLFSSTKIFIDSKEIIADKNQIDLSNLILKEGGKKYRLTPGEHSLKCPGISPAYFFIEEYKTAAGASIHHGWIISSNDLRPVKNGERPDIIGLKIKKSGKITDDINLRPFLSQIYCLRNRYSDRSRDAKLKTIERRKNYGC